jgi:hypothetical protein
MPCRDGHILNYDRRCRFCGISLEFEAAAIFGREDEEEDERSGESPSEDEGSSVD